MDPTQLLLQNLLAKAACLLHSAGELLTLGENQCLLKIEITSFMLGATRSLSSHLLRQGAEAILKESAQSAPTVERIGQNWTSPLLMKGTNMSSHDGPVGGAGTPTSPPEASGSSSAGGILELPPTSPPQPEIFPHFSSPGNALPGHRKSSAFLSLTCSNGKKLLIAKASIANILQQDEGCLIYYNGCPANPDEVLESFSYIESELLCLE